MSSTSRSPDPETGTAISTYPLDTASDNWGNTWLGSELFNANFRVRATESFLLEYLAAQVTYTPERSPV
jgi:hypothetical protein